MGLRFRKSVKLGPFRLNFSKSGIGYSYGVKGYRVTHKAGGGVRKTASIPGTGISYVTETSSQTTASTRQTSNQEAKTMPTRPEGRCVQMTDKDGMPYYIRYIKCPYCKEEVLETAIRCPYCNKKLNAEKRSGGAKAPKVAAGILAGVVALGGVGLMSGGEDPSPAPTPAPIVQVVDPAPEPEPEPVVDKTPVIAEPEPAPDTPAAEESSVAAPDPTPAPVPVVTPEPAPEPEQSEQVEIVYVLNTNTKKFHKPDCPSVEDILPKNYAEMSDRDKIISQGYKECKRCYP